MIPGVFARASRARPAGPALAGAVLVALAVAVAFPGLLTGRDPAVTDLTAALSPPGAGHLFGTDELGRDVLARVVYGARTSLLIGIGATVLGALGGTVIGLVAAAGGRRVDQALMRLLDVALAVPELLLALVIVAFTGTGTANVLVAVGLAAVPNYARVVRGQALVAVRSGYAEAAIGLGTPWPVIVLRHVLPNVAGPLLLLATTGTGTSIISGSALSFLGLGPEPPAVEWGAMLADGRENLAVAWWPGVFPGLAVVAVVMSVTVVGRWLQARAEGRTA
ncbi:peptide ABC transporter permease [Sphaerisporangium siamense]|uniref:Peptide/nickel transport system permease protein n=1 Tax=Sphaerisporangium siamense TaxID=795645 RepID=A0A7W7D6A7_9ACTN|nr:ABC transporter permease [Sphaerisporangium siamense]MBB4700977.1 peptide/nickel transport system permease protein [Sphaerisporangium siamense]GII85877.1 peptide ABC transporter permease [Sphaerisporangium siamense]